MPNKTTFKAVEFQPRVDLTHRVVSFRFLDKAGNELDVWFVGSTFDFVKSEIDRMARENPEMQTWAENYRPV